SRLCGTRFPALRGRVNPVLSAGGKNAVQEPCPRRERPVIELAVAFALSVVVGVAWGLTVRSVPRADPARAASRKVEAGLESRPRRRRFLAARVDPGTATGLGL